MNTEELVAAREAQIAQINDEIAILRQLKPQLDTLTLGRRMDGCGDATIMFYAGQVDFDYLTHSDVVNVMLAFPGTWTKTKGWSGINYETLWNIGESKIHIRCYNGEPPPSCKRVEEWVDVPPQPATRKMVTRYVCPGGETI